MPSIEIVSASEADREWCAHVMASSDPWITLQRDFNGCRSYLSRPGADLFLARDETRQPRGFIFLAPYGFASSPYVASIGVVPEFRSRGVGDKLLAFAEQRYRDRKHLFLLVSSFNSRAQHFYQRHGFEFIGELKDYIVAGHSELIFHKRLS
jgi:ribosomal-protein-alanine N-acetyltransferase